MISVLGVRTQYPYPQLSESHLQLMNRRIPKKNPFKNRAASVGSKGMVWVPWTRPQVEVELASFGRYVGIFFGKGNLLQNSIKQKEPG